jgi:F-type H+-transporting ATPase subunit b
MNELFVKLGLDWKLLLAQAVNFLILLYLLSRFVYRPLLKVLADRRARVEEGFAKADEADRRLADTNDMVKAKMKQAEEEAMTMLRSTEAKAKELEASLMAEAQKKQAAMLESAERLAAAKADEAAAKVRAEAKELMRNALAKAVSMKPESIDEALIESAVKEMKVH